MSVFLQYFELEDLEEFNDRKAYEKQRRTRRSPETLKVGEKVLLRIRMSPDCRAYARQGWVTVREVAPRGSTTAVQFTWCERPEVPFPPVEFDDGMMVNPQPEAGEPTRVGYIVSPADDWDAGLARLLEERPLVGALG